MITEKDFKKIMKAFDFGKVQRVMWTLDWKYARLNPVTIQELKNMAWCLYEGFPDWNVNERCSSASGGFILRKPHGAKYLTLSFCVEEQVSEEIK